MSAETKPMPCPWCGGTDFVMVDTVKGLYGFNLRCNGSQCHANGPEGHTPEMALTLYNTRQPSPDLGRVREALEECEWRGHATLAQRKECKEQSGSYDCDHFFCPICHAHDEDSDHIQHELDCLLAEALSLLAPSTQPAPVKGGEGV